MAIPTLIRPDENKEYYTDEGCHILEVLNQADYPSYSLARARVAPQRTTALHALRGIDEAYYILEGKGEAEVNSTPTKTLIKGDLVFIPKGESQRITNTGNTDLVFLCICAPRFELENYELIEENNE